jgi:hypothetical protein
MKKSFLQVCVLGAMMGLSLGNAWAGRPLTVDDANTNDKGAGHVEVWAAREEGKVNTLNLAPAFAPFEGIELGALLSRNTTEHVNVSAVQAKWRITPSNEKGCNVAAVLGVAHESNGGGNATYLNGILSCNGNALGNVHFNLGAIKAKGVSAVGTWGVAIEREMGAVTPHIELFGAEHEKPTVQVGLRGQLTKTIQLDGTVGRSNGESLYSVGMKFQF